MTSLSSSPGGAAITSSAAARSGAAVGPFTVNDTTDNSRSCSSAPRPWASGSIASRVGKDHWLKSRKSANASWSAMKRERLEEATRDDYAPFFAFAHATGLRLNECLLGGARSIGTSGQIVKIGKGGNRSSRPDRRGGARIFGRCAGDIRWPFLPCRGARAERVGGWSRARATRWPIGLKTAWRRLRAESRASPDFRFHDFRHNVGTKLLRETGNLKLVQRALNHADLETTARYAHVLDSDVAEAMRRFREQNFDAAPTTLPTTNAPEERKPLRQRR